MAHQIPLASVRHKPMSQGQTGIASAFPLLRCFARSLWGRLDFPAYASAAAAQNGLMTLDQLPGAGHDGAGGTWPKRRSAGVNALANAGWHD